MFKNKNLVIDTSVLIDNPQSIHEFSNCNIFLTLEILEELDKHKVRRDHVGKAARYVNRFLDGVRKEQSLSKGAQLDNGSTIFVVNGKGFLHSGFEEPSNDNKIISVAYKLNIEIGDIGVLSNDIAFRVKCDSLDIPAYKHTSKKVAEQTAKKYTGIREIDVLKADIDILYMEGALVLPDEEFELNECVILRSGQSSALAIATEHDEVRTLMFAGERGFNVEGIKPRSAEQAFALEMLLDPDISLLTITGKAGCGKTLLTIASAMHSLHKKTYDKIIISRPVESTSKDIGYLPGTKEEKMAPWVQPIFDNLNTIYKKKGMHYVESMINKGDIEVEALTYIRGRSLPRTIFIIDEAQNINYEEAKAVITRMGEDSKIILIGDLEQIDSDKLNEITSGLANTVEVFKPFEGAAHVTLQRGERSPLATFAAENM